MKYKYTVKSIGMKLDFDVCPPELGDIIFPSKDWESVSIDQEQRCYEFIFAEKKTISFSNDFIIITETEI